MGLGNLFRKKSSSSNFGASDKGDVFTQGMAYISEGNYDKAIKLLEKTKEYNTIVQKETLLGFAYSEKGDYNKAIEWFEKSIKLQPYDGSLYFCLATAYLKKGDTSKSFEYLKEAAKLGDGIAQEALSSIGDL
jgi:tetratricopeptide (TPR) repeat protein